MSYKVGTVLIDIKADTAKLVSGMQKAERNIKNATEKIKYSLGAIAAAWATMEAALKFKELGMSFVETAAKFEQFSVALKSIEGSSKVAQKSMQWIQDFSAKTPYTLEQVTRAFIKLRAYGLNAKKDLKWLGDVASAMGKPLGQAIEAIADAVNGEFERLKEFGVKGFQQGDKVALQWVTRSGEVKHIIIENNAQIIESTLKAIWNSRYAGAMQEQSKTWSGLLSTIQGNWEIFKTNLMKTGVFDYLKANLIEINKELNKMYKRSESSGLTNSINSAIQSTMRGIAGISKALNFLERTILGIKLVWLVFKEAVLGSAAAIEQTLAAMYNRMAKINNIINPFHKMQIANPNNGWYTQALKENTQEIKKTSYEIARLGHESDAASKKIDSFFKNVNKTYKKLRDESKNTFATLHDYAHNLLTSDLSVKGAESGIFKGFNVSDEKQKLLDLHNYATELWGNEFNFLTDKQFEIMQNLKQENISFLPKREQILTWYEDMKKQINLFFDDIEKRKKALKLLDDVTINKLRNDTVSTNNASNKNNYADSLAGHYDTTTMIKYTIVKAGDSLSEGITNLFNNNKIVDAVGDSVKTLFGAIARHFDAFVSITTKSLKFMFEDAYDKIKAKYIDKIDDYQTANYDKKLQANAYSAFGYSGYSKVANYQADVANINMLKEQNDMNYELSKKAKEYKETTQNILESESLALGAAGAVRFDGGAVLEGINDAMKSQDWAEQATGFKTFQQAYIEGVNEYKQSLRDLADEMISLAGDIYKSIDDYRSDYDKITGTNTYEMQKYAESLQYIGQYTALTSDSLAEFTQSILEADKGFVEGAVNISSNADELLNTDLFTNYGLAIDGLNEKFKDSLSVVADLIDKQREANKTIKDYVAELKGIAGDNDYNLQYTQQQYAQAKQDYLTGKIDSNELLDKAKAFQGAAGDNADLINLLANSLEGVTEQSTEDYLQGILENTANLATVGLPDTNIEDLTAPEVDTVDAIEDTNNFLEQLLDIMEHPDDLFKGITSILKDILNAIKHIGAAVWDAFKDAITDIWLFVRNFFNNLWKGVWKVGAAVWEFEKNALLGLWDWTKEFFKTLFSSLKAVFTEIIAPIIDPLKSIADAVKDVLNAIKSVADAFDMGGITDIFKDPVGSVSNLWTATTDFIKNPIGSISHLFAEGGFTGSGTYTDSTGERVAGIVHEGEWVAPKWMVNSFPSLFSSLEKARISKSDISIPALAVANNNVNVSVNIAEIQHTNSILQSQLSIQKKMLRLMQKFDEEGIKCIS